MTDATAAKPAAAGSEIERILHYMGLDSAFSIVQSRPQAAAELAHA